MGTAQASINRQRWDRFKRNRRGYYSLILFLIFYCLTLGANLIANDKPYYVAYKGSLYFPMVKAYPETTFGGVFETETNYRDPAVQALIQSHGHMVFPPIPYSYRTINYGVKTPAPAAPSQDNFLGTDDQGRDLLARLLYGLRITISFGLVLTLFSSVIGIFMGAIQGFLGGRVDLTLQRLTEIWSGLPILYLLIIISSLVEPGFWWLLGILVLFKWMTLVSVVRAEFLKARNYEYVKAARVLGLSNTKIMWRHVLPNAMVASLTFLPFILNASITTLTSLDFLGFGLPPDSASLGEILSQGKNNIQAPWLGLTGFFTLSILLTLLIFIGEAIRDAFDPRKIYGHTP